MKKFLFLIAIFCISINALVKAQCPPNATAFAINYPLCVPDPGCGVLLNGWPEGVVVKIFGGEPLQLITSVQIPGTYPGPGTGDAFVCVPCNTKLVFASTVPNATSGCVIVNTISVPIKLSSFSANQLENNTCKINWTTVSQTGFEKFVVERSTDSKNYSEVATIKSQGATAGEKNYSYTDVLTDNSGFYYRLKTIDITGKITYSEVAYINHQSNTEISVYPNPVVNNFKVTLSNKQLPALVKIYNAQGEVVYNTKTSSPTLLITKKIKSGVYIIKIISAYNNYFSQKFIVQ
jgi:hypothetical protein